MLLSSVVWHDTTAATPADYSNQIIDVSMEDSTVSAATALKQYEFEKSAAKQREHIADLDAKSSAKLDAAVAGLRVPSFLARTAILLSGK